MTRKTKTVIRTILQVLAIVLWAIAQFGIESEWATAVTTVGTIIITTVNFWKNNSFTDAAQCGDAVMDYLKGSLEDDDDTIIETILNKVIK